MSNTDSSQASQPKKTIKFGIVCESKYLESWAAACIADLLSSGNSELSLLIYVDIGISNRRPEENPLVSAVFHLYRNLLARSRCFAKIDLSGRFKNIPELFIRREGTRTIAPCLSDENIKCIREVGLDFLLIFSESKDLFRGISGIPKYGIWYFRHGGFDGLERALPCFWEMYRKDKAVGVELLKFGQDKDRDIPLRIGYFEISYHSYFDTLNDTFRKSIHLGKEVLQDIWNDNWNELELKEIHPRAIAPRPPSSKELFEFLLRIFTHKIKRTYNNLCRIEKWNIGFIKVSLEDLLEKSHPVDIHSILPRMKNAYFADPFVLRLDKNVYVLFEHFKYKQSRALISGIKIKDSISNPEIDYCLEKPYHISYPSMFKYGDDVFLLPEASLSGKLTLYKAIKFPVYWEEFGILMENVSAADPTLFQYEGLWWLAFTQREQEQNLRLFLFYSNNFLGPWFPHKRNPVKTDISSSRPAGMPFTYKGSLIRPSQDSSMSYGGAVVFNKITKLTPHEFHEEPLAVLSPSRIKNSNISGIHTFNQMNGLVVVDYKQPVHTLSKIPKVLTGKISRRISSGNLIRDYRIIDKPMRVDKKAYDESISRTTELLKQHESVVSVYQNGRINNPGISDLDIVVIFEDSVSCRLNPRLHMSKEELYLFPHNLVGMPRSHFRDVGKYSIWPNLKHIWGEVFSLPEAAGTTGASLKSIRFQTAVEYLLDNYIDLSLQLTYGVIKLRALFQHVKAIGYDLELLNISSGQVADMYHQLLGWLNAWFEKPVDSQTIFMWLETFYIELKNLINGLTKSEPFYVPDWANLAFGRNLEIRSGQNADFDFSGFLLPKYITGRNKRTFNLNSAFNKFIFWLPFSSQPKESILEERILFCKKQKDYASHFHPNFQPLMTGFAQNIISSKIKSFQEGGLSEVNHASF